MKKRYSLLTITLILSIIACNTENTTEVPVFNIHEYHTVFVNEIVTTANTEFVKDATTLNNAIASFLTVTNTTNLTAVKNAWKNATISYAKTEIGDVGIIKNTAIHLSIYSWGANENNIDTFLASTNNISKNTINSLPTKSRGLSAIEYLLFNDDENKTLADFANNRRKDFLAALGNNLLEKANSLERQWADYSNTFINNTSTGINGSINNIVNQINVLLENNSRFKIGEPAGLENTSFIDTDLLQAEKSEISLTIIQENINSIKNAYFTNTENGLDSYVSNITGNNSLNNRIQNKFNDLENTFTSLNNTSLKAAITNNNNMVTTLYNQLKELIVLIKVDVASTLSVTVTFTDNDGD